MDDRLQWSFCFSSNLCYFLSFFTHTSISHKWPINVLDDDFNFQTVNAEVRMRTVCVSFVYIPIETNERDKNSMQMLAVCPCAITFCQSVHSIVMCERKKDKPIEHLSTLATHSHTRTHPHGHESTPFAPISIFFSRLVCVFTETVAQQFS